MLDKVAVKGGLCQMGIAVLGHSVITRFLYPCTKRSRRAMDVNKYDQGAPSNHNNFLALFCSHIIETCQLSIHVHPYQPFVAADDGRNSFNCA